jgi:hypothetical protein
MRVIMNKELTLLIPDSLLLQLELRAREQGVSVETLCLSLLSGVKQEEDLVDPSYYRSLSHTGMRQEVNKVIESSLPSEEIRRRLNNLEFEISRRYR